MTDAPQEPTAVPTPPPVPPTLAQTESQPEPLAETAVQPAQPAAETAVQPAQPLAETAATAAPLPAQPFAEAAAPAAPQPPAPLVEATANAAQQPPVPPTGNPAAFTKPAVPTPPKRSAGVGLVAALAIGALVGGVSGAGVTVWALSSNQSSNSSNTASPATVTVNNTDDVTQITAVAAAASPSVVTISVSSGQTGGTGSGVVLSKDGYVLTNAHVVTLDGSIADPKISVQTNDGRLLSAKVVGVDPVADLAVIKLDGVDNLQPAKFANSDKLNVGDTAIAIGAPLGLAGTVTNGIVSALNRSITVASSAVPEEQSQQDQAPDTGQNPYDFWKLDVPGQDNTPTASSATISLPVIQTDAAINPGNSGGALLNSKGEVIGINVAIATAGSSSSGSSGSIGVGFAIPANFAQRIANELIEKGAATHGLLGAAVVDVTEDSTQTASQVVGASIQEVTAGGAAANAGLKAGDIITGFNGVPITGKTDLTAQVRALAAGSKATVTYVRDGKAATAEVTLGALQ